MAAAYNDTCFSTDAAALAAVCTSKYPYATADQAGNPLLQTCLPSVGAITVTSASSAASSSTTFPVTFPSCDPFEHYADVTLLWSLGLGLAFILLAVRGTFSFLWKDY